MSKTCLAKIGWKVSKRDKDLWCNVLKGKYGRFNSLTSINETKIHDSSLWKNIVNTWPLFGNIVVWVVGNGESMDVANDCWVASGILLRDFMHNNSNDHQNNKVANLIDENGDSDCTMLNMMFNQEILDMIATIHPPRNEIGKDVCICGGINIEAFSISNAYAKIFDIRNNNSSDDWKNFWKFQVSERIRLFIWLMHHNDLKMKQFLAQTNICDLDYVECVGMEESTIHALRDCKAIRHIWLALVHNSHWETFFCLNVQDWLKLNVHDNISNQEGENWQATWATTWHAIWHWRNQRLFVVDFIMPQNPVRDFKEHVQQFMINSLLLKKVSLELRTAERIRWILLENDWLTLNTNGTVYQDHNTCCGGVIRDNNDKRIGGFTKLLEKCTIMIVELWDILEGINYFTAERL